MDINTGFYWFFTLKWRHNERDGVSNFTQRFCSGADQREHQSSASLSFVREIHWRLLNSPYKGPETQKMFPLDDIIMIYMILRSKQNGLSLAYSCVSNGSHVSNNIKDVGCSEAMNDQAVSFGAAIWHHGYLSRLVQVIPWWLMTSNHCLDQSWGIGSQKYFSKIYSKFRYYYLKRKMHL